MKRFLGHAGLCLLSGLLFFLGVHSWWPLAFVSLSPLAICFCLSRRWWGAVLWAGISGTLMWYFIQYPLWVYNQGGIFLLACYQSLSVIVMALGTRAVWRRWHVRLVWIWPVAVVTGEYLRMIGLFGVPFGSLAGCCVDQNWMLQVCDLGGIYTLSFPIAMVQGLVADQFLRRFYSPGRPLARWAPVTAVGAAWGAVAIYGHLRSSEIESTMRPGPRIAVIQPDVVYVLNSVQSYDPGLLLQRLKDLTEQAAQEGEPPDLIVWPEGISSFPLRSRELFEAQHDPRMEQDPQRWEEIRAAMAEFEGEFASWVQRLGAPLIVGMNVSLPTEAGSSSRAFDTYNAAQFYDPATGQTSDRQFKMRLYPGGEYFPWSGSWIDRALGDRGIFPSVFGVANRFEPGRRRERFHLGEDPSIPAYSVSICSEILSPLGSGVFLRAADREKPFGFLINIANEGSFLRNTAQLHQFAYLPFRAIETRAGIARSSNTGISGFVAPTGEIYGLVTDQNGQARTGLGAPELDPIGDLMEFRIANEHLFRSDPEKRAELDRRVAEIEALREAAGVEGFSVDRVYTYPGRTVYQRFGDWLGTSMSLAFGCLCGLSVVIRRNSGPAPEEERRNR